MKFIERLFGKKQEKEESHPTVFEFDDLSATVSSEISKQEEILKPVVKERYEGIKISLRYLDKLKKELLKAEAIEGVSKRGEKLGDSNRDNVANNLKLIHDKLKVPGNTSPLAAAEFYMDAKSTLKTVLDNTRRSLMYIKALYPGEYEKTNQGLADLEDGLDGLYSSVMEGNARIDNLQKIAEETESIKEIRHGMEKSNKRLLELDEKYESVKKEVSLFDSKLIELDESSEFLRAKELEEHIRLLDNKIADVVSEARRWFTPLSKAISRMEKQDENKRCVLSPENREILRIIRDDPAKAMEHDLGPFLLELGNRIESGELGLKDQMRDKALKQIDVLNKKKDLEELADKRRSYSAEKEALLMELSGLSIYREREGIERKIEEHHVLLRSVNTDIESEKIHYDNLMEELERTRSVLLADVRNAFGNESVIEYDDL